MNKPVGYVCSAVSDSHKTVYELLTPELQNLVQNAKRGDRLHTVGRLDCDTSGLLLFTTDGYFSDYLTRSQNHIEKTYLAKLKESVNAKRQEEYTKLASQSLLLPPEKKAPEEYSLPAKIDWQVEDELKKWGQTPMNQQGQTYVKITVTEGKFHEVRRIFRALGNEVIELKRIAIQNLTLKELNLPDGHYKSLI